MRANSSSFWLSNIVRSRCDMTVREMFAPCDSRMDMISNGAAESRPGCTIRGAPSNLHVCVSV